LTALIQKLGLSLRVNRFILDPVAGCPLLSGQRRFGAEGVIRHPREARPDDWLPHNPPALQPRRRITIRSTDLASSGKSNYANPNQFHFVKSPREKYSASVFRKIMVLLPRPASMKRGERVVTIVRRDAMDVMEPRDERRSCMRQRRMVLTPLGWC
jgi:hypothetical protein